MSEYPEGVTEMDHILHDMRMGFFPKRSPVDEFLERRGTESTFVDPFAEGRVALAKGIAETFEGMTFDDPRHAIQWLESAITRALTATEEKVRRRLR